MINFFENYKLRTSNRYVETLFRWKIQAITIELLNSVVDQLYTFAVRNQKSNRKKNQKKSTETFIRVFTTFFDS